MTRTVAREIAIQLSFAAQLAGDDARETADTFFSREYFASLALFEEGSRLLAACNEMLDTAEQKVVQLKKGSDGAPVELPFETEE